MQRSSRLTLAVSFCTLLPLARFASGQAASEQTSDVRRLGHSAHGEAWDEGPRERPWRMEGIGQTHFPITTSLPEVQEWFDQGNTLLHSFWYYEAERSFRYCVELDPECAMAYWGLARSAGGRYGDERMKAFLREAVKRKASVTRREQMYIEAWEKAFVPELSGALEEIDPATPPDEFKELVKELELLCVEFPDDLEAKALHGLYALYSPSRLSLESLFQELLVKEPEHPGLHHYRIHNWDGPEGRVALDSCAAYGRIAWNVGHANHMPGHIYSGIGMWSEGAIWMDSATRVEKRYMQEHMVFPYNHWNYAHNLNYLAYIQEQLGMRTAALDDARQLIAAPLDPKYNDAAKGGRVHQQGKNALIRGLVKFERWDDILAEGTIPWIAPSAASNKTGAKKDGKNEAKKGAEGEDTEADAAWRHYCEALAHLGKNDLSAAIDDLVKLERLGKPGEKPTGARALMRLEVAGLVAHAKGEELEAVRLLSEGAKLHLERFDDDNDPPRYPRPIGNVLGELLLARGDAALAAQHFEAVLKTIPNDGFALSGLVRARASLGERDKAAEAYGKLLFVWSNADPGLRWLEECKELGLRAEPHDAAPTAQRDYKSQVLDTLGPATWEPYAAPELSALDADGKQVTLAEYAGQNVLLVFYLGTECPHCIEQLQAIEKRKADFEGLDVALLAISGDSPAEVQASEKMGKLPFRLLADADHANARRFKSYDDFEGLELHSTIFIDRAGRVRWARSGGDPFTDLDFLLAEIRRVEDAVQPAVAVEASSEVAPAGGGR